MLIQVTRSLSKRSRSSFVSVITRSSTEAGSYSMSVMTGGPVEAPFGTLSEPGDSPGTVERRLNMAHRAVCAAREQARSLLQHALQNFATQDRDIMSLC